MSMQSRIEAKLRHAFAPDHLEVLNESSAHNVPPGSESHFKVVIVAACFEGKGLLERHRSINEALAEELAGPVHALSIHVHTPREWGARGQAVSVSPPCLGGGKRRPRGQ